MSNNLSIEAPNFDKIDKEAGQYTASAISTLWAALNDTRKTERLHYLIISNEEFVGSLEQAPSASLDNLDMRGFSLLLFTGSSAQNFTGIVAPETGRVKVVMVKVVGSATITVKNNATSLAANRIALANGADYSMTTGKGLVLAYVNSLYQEIARSV